MEVTLTALSPFLQFSPYADGPSTSGWKASGPTFGYSTPSGESDRDVLRWTESSSSSFQFRFNGSAAYVYGETHGSATYAVSVDGTESTPSSPTGGQLAAVKGLGSGEHLLTFNVTAAGGDSWVAIDRAAFTAQGGSHTNYTYDDGDTTRFFYSAGWGVGAAASQGTYLGTSTYTNVQGANCRVNFQGSAIYLYGSVQPDHGVYSVSVDGAPAHTFNGTSRAGFVQQLLYFASGFDQDAQHTLVVTDVDGTKLDLDYIQVVGPKDYTQTRRIAGISVGGASAALIAGGVVAWIWYVERRGRGKLDAYVREFVEKSNY